METEIIKIKVTLSVADALAARVAPGERVLEVPVADLSAEDKAELEYYHERENTFGRYRVNDGDQYGVGVLLGVATPDLAGIHDALLASKADRAKKEEAIAASHARMLDNYREVVEKFLSIPDGPETLYIYRDGTISHHSVQPAQLKGVRVPSLPDCPNEICRVEEAMRLTAQAKEHIAAIKAHNEKLVHDHGDEVAAMYAAHDKKKAEAEQRKADAEKRAKAAAAVKAEKDAQEEKEAQPKRLTEAVYAETFNGYDSDNYSTPWGAQCVRKGANDLDFIFVTNAYDGDASGGIVRVPCMPGEVIAVGQKGRVGNPTYLRYLQMIPSGAMKVLMRGGAVHALKEARTKQSDTSRLADIPDEELLAEVARRGLSVKARVKRPKKTSP